MARICSKIAFSVSAGAIELIHFVQAGSGKRKMRKYKSIWPPSAFRPLLSCLLVFGLGGLISESHGQRARTVDPVTADQVRTAIEGGKKYLLAEQEPRGNWGQHGQYPGGVTGLCTLALLNAGLEPSHPKVQKALAYLRKLKAEKTYSVALQTMALCAANPRRDALLIQKNVRWLEENQIERDDRAGSWAYPGPGGDNSNSQFAVLALHEAQRVGAMVDPATWRRAAEYWRRCQHPDGSWGYQPGRPGTGSMTCAGIGATVICQGKVTPADAKIQEGQVRCCLPQELDDSLERALTWLGRTFSVNRNPGSRGLSQVWHYYYLYGVERVGRLTARRFIGEHDWYREGAEYLIGQQDVFTRSWTGSGHAENNPHISTALALLFLSKGRRPVLLSKLKHSSGSDWNRHRSDVAHLTAHAERLWGLDLTWQLTEIKTASVEDLLQSPVLILSGSQAFEMKGQEKKLRAYLDRGGFLFAEACCAESSRFVRAFQNLVGRMFPESEYQLRMVGPEHPLWRVEQTVSPESSYAGRLSAVEYGCRTCVVLSEVDLSCFWELSQQVRTHKYPPIVAQRMKDAMAIGVNVLAYATGRDPQGKEVSFGSAGSEANLDVLGPRGVIQIVKLQHGGGCNDAPGALVNLLRTANGGESKLRISTSEVPIYLSDKNLFNYHLAFMHGRHDFKLTPIERQQLRKFLENGGTLMADSICTSKPFALAFRRELKAALPDATLAPIPINHPMFTEACGGYDIQKVKRRDPARQQAGTPLRPRVRTVAPELEGIVLDGRMAVIFSPYDISCALEQHEALQCHGYTRKDAARIGLNVLMYSLNPDAGKESSATPAGKAR
jgi:hypothetical protein